MSLAIPLSDAVPCTLATDRVQVTLLAGFEMRADGELVPLPVSAQRLIAFLALHQRPVQRLYAAGILWPDVSDERAGASLRSALWRLRRPGWDVVVLAGPLLSLAAHVATDVPYLVTAAHQLADDSAVNGSLSADDAALVGRFQDEILPDWYDDWVTVWRERWRQIRLHALEALAARLSAAGRHARAVEAGLAAAQADPLRESSHRSLIMAHLAEGNRAEALRQYDAFCLLLASELGVGPSPALKELIAGWDRTPPA